MVNLKIARALSRKRFLKRIKTKLYKLESQRLELHLTFTVNNIFVNFSNGVGNSYWLRTFGMVGYNGAKRKTRYALYYYGIEAGEQLTSFLSEWKQTSLVYKNRDIATIPLRLVLHSAVSRNSDLRYKRFMHGLRKSSFYFYEFEMRQNVPYNGCRPSASRRTRRVRFFR